MGQKKILLAAYTFPPNQGIGGRRWAKFAKILAEKGWKVYVVKAAPVKNNILSPWTEDVMHQNIIVHELPRRYPSINQSINPSKKKNTFYSFLIRLKNKINWIAVRYLTRGTFTDKAAFWERVFIRKSSELIKEHSIRYIIGTGAPFNVIFFCAKLKDIYPEIKLLIDYRDPYINTANYGMSMLSPKKLRHERMKFIYSISKADYITAPNKFLVQNLVTTAKPAAMITHKCFVLPHTFDESDLLNYKIFSSLCRGTNNKITITYGGSIGEWANQALESLNEILTDIKNKHPFEYNKLTINFYTNRVGLLSYFTNHPIVNIQKTIGKKFFEKLATSTYSIIFSGGIEKDWLTTKFPEYLFFENPILIFGDRGYLTEYVEKHKLGLHISNSEKLFSLVRGDYNDKFIDYSSTEFKEILNSWSLENVTNTLIEKFIS